MNLQSVSSIARSGMSTAVQRLSGASARVAGLATQPDIQTEDLARNVVEQRVALYEFKANMQAFKTGQEMLGTLLDLRA
jgi:flagellar basal body rod protein FlgC